MIWKLFLSKMYLENDFLLTDYNVVQLVESGATEGAFGPILLDAWQSVRLNRFLNSEEKGIVPCIGIVDQSEAAVFFMQFDIKTEVWLSLESECPNVLQAVRHNFYF